MEFNINNAVTFTLTKRGEQILHAEYDERIKLCSNKNKSFIWG